MSAINQLNIGFPGGTTAGNIMVVVVFSDQIITAPTPTWTEFVSGSAGGVHYSASAHTATAAEIAAGTTWNWGLAAFTSKVGFDIMDFANVTAFDKALVNSFTTPVSSMAAPSIAATNNELCFAFWIALNETTIRPPTIPTIIAGTFARGGISHSTVVFSAAATGPTGDLTAGVDVASAGVAVQAAIAGAGSHFVSISGGAIS